MYSVNGVQIYVLTASIVVITCLLLSETDLQVIIPFLCTLK